MNKKASQILEESLRAIGEWKDSYGEWEQEPSLNVPDEKVQEVFGELSKRMEGNYPFHHPVYAGQMLKPPHPLAWAAYAVAMTINPNNHALDGGPPSSEMEKEVLAELADFFGYSEGYLGHLTASGTIANLEALWIARQSHPDKKIAYSENSHYTHQRMCGVLGVESVCIPVDQRGAFRLNEVNADEIGTLVVTLGTTGLGDVEPLPELLEWTAEHGIRVHIDAAYGGFFRALKNSELIDGEAWARMQEADSIVVDPHKHGLQPYGCGCVLFKDPGVGQYYKHDSPYTYFTSDDLHLGEISLECSRAGAAAVALWVTLKLFPLKENEGFGLFLKKCRKAALKVAELMKENDFLQVYKNPALDILGYFPVQTSTCKTSEISALSRKVFEKGMKDRSYYLSLYKVNAETFHRLHPSYQKDTDEVTILRSVFMKPEHHDFASVLVTRLEEAVKEAN